MFRGFLVSTLECQECLHQSDRAEYFLDLSLPVAASRPQPPAVVRRKTPNGMYSDCMMFVSSVFLCVVANLITKKLAKLSIKI